MYVPPTSNANPREQAGGPEMVKYCGPCTHCIAITIFPCICACPVDTRPADQVPYIGMTTICCCILLGYPCVLCFPIDLKAEGGSPTEVVTDQPGKDQAGGSPACTVIDHEPGMGDEGDVELATEGSSAASESD